MYYHIYHNTLHDNRILYYIMRYISQRRAVLCSHQLKITKVGRKHTYRQNTECGAESSDPPLYFHE